MTEALYARIADLTLVLDETRLEPLSQRGSGGWVRHTTIVTLVGRGHEGVGEDVTWEEVDQLVSPDRLARLLGRAWRFDDLSRALESVDLFPAEPGNSASRLYRRWAIESAALDLALRQRGFSLATLLDRPVRPLRFLASLGLGEPPSLAPLTRRLDLNPDLEFKVDYAESWTPALVQGLARLGRIPVIDLKGQYRGVFRGPDGDPERYRVVAEAMHDTVLEDPEWTPDIAAALRPHLDRVSWDAPVHSVADLDALPFPPRWLNIKPSRFGSVRELFHVYEACEQRGIAMYGGGQFELGPGRGQAQLLASLFHADGPNDLAPGVYNRDELGAELPASPLRIENGVGFRPS